MTIYIFKYNNYYNRIYKRLESLSEYEEQGEMIYYIRNANFNPNDGVSTSHIFGQNGIPSSDFQTYDGSGDYVIVLNDNNEIDSRWFIIEARRKMAGQFELILRRDLIADYKNEIFNATTFVEKGNVGFQNPLVFNQENMTLNKIKRGETLLKDSTGCPWIVGYIPRDLAEKNNGEGYTPLITPDYYIKSDAASWEYYSYTTNDFKCFPQDNSYLQLVVTNSSLTWQYFLNFSVTGEYSFSQRGTAFANGVYFESPTNPFDINYIPNMTKMVEYYKNLTPQYFSQRFATGYNLYQTKDKTEDLLKYKDKIIQFNNGIYRVKFTEGTWRDTRALGTLSSTNYTAMLVDLQTICDEYVSDGLAYNYNALFSNVFNFDFTGTKIRITLEKLSNVDETAIKWTIPSTSYRAHLQDAPYDMFCIPYGAIDIVYGETTFTTSPEIGMSIANNIISNLVTSQSGELYDIQLLPYCPLKEEVRVGNIITLDNFVNNTFFSIVTQGVDNIPINAIFFCDSSSFRTNIPYSVEIKNAKIESNTDMYRLSSPNYNGQFEFNAAMNNGISYFSAECTYIPFTPYIHVKPDFNGLYGENFNDARGLICGGDFSLPVVNDAWNSYKLQNKNFKEIFDRQIQNMNIQHDVARVQEVFNIIGGTAQGSMSGAMTGAMSSGGNPYAAIAGGVIGGAASLAGGIADIGLNEKLRIEAIDYTRDQFQFNLGNIQALPNSLTRVTSYNINNRVFPVLEYYTCTDEEKVILANKIAYNGMTINSIGKLIEYVQDWNYEGIISRRYVKGKIIYIDLNDEFHLASSISDEVYKGFFVGNEVI